MDEQIIKLLQEILKTLEDIKGNTDITVRYTEDGNDKLENLYHKLTDIESSID